MRKVTAAVVALWFVAAGCAPKIEPTNLSAISSGSDRKAVEDMLGSPIAIENFDGALVAAYHFNKGIGNKDVFNKVFLTYSGSRWRQGCRGADIRYLVLPALICIFVRIDHADEWSEYEALQRGTLLAVFDANHKLAYIGKLPNSEYSLPQNLSEIAANYAAAKSNGAEALFALSVNALIPQQRDIMLRKAAEIGYVPAQRELGKLLLSSNTEQDRKKAKEELARAAKSGDEEAKSLLLYFELENVTSGLNAKTHDRSEQAEARAAYGKYLQLSERAISVAESWRWLCRAADLGNTHAQKLLGYWHRNDIKQSPEWQSTTRQQAGIHPDNRTAFMWYTIAAASGDEIAKNIQELLVKKFIMTKGEILEAMHWAKHRKPGECSGPKVDR